MSKKRALVAGDDTKALIKLMSEYSKGQWEFIEMPTISKEDVFKINCNVFILIKNRRNTIFGPEYQAAYKMFERAASTIPLILVVSGCESEEDMESYWNQNKYVFTDVFNWKVAEAVSGCFLEDAALLEGREESCARLLQTLNKSEFHIAVTIERSPVSSSSISCVIL